MERTELTPFEQKCLNLVGACKAGLHVDNSDGKRMIAALRRLENLGRVDSTLEADGCGRTYRVYDMNTPQHARNVAAANSVRKGGEIGARIVAAREGKGK